MGAIPVPAVSVCSAGAATFSALIEVPAAHPGSVGSEPSVTGAGEAAHRVGAGGLYATVGSPIEVDVVNITLVQLVAGGKWHVCVTVVTISTVLIHPAASSVVPTPVVVLVADSVAAVVIIREANACCVVGILGCGKILGVETQVIATPGPARVDAVSVLLTVTLPLPAGVVWGAPPLTAVILCIPPAPRGGAVVLTTDHDSLTVVVMVTVALPQSTGVIRSAAVFPAPAGPGQGVQHCSSHHHLLLPAITLVRQGVLEECEAGELAQQRHVAEAVRVTHPAQLLVVETLVGAVNGTPGLFRR